jgi:hypothetical protein
MPVRPKPIFSNQSYSSQDKTNFLHSKPFKSGKNQLPTFHALQVSQKPTFSILSHSSQSNIVNEFSSSPCLVAASHRTIQFLFISGLNQLLFLPYLNMTHNLKIRNCLNHNKKLSEPLKSQKSQFYYKMQCKNTAWTAHNFLLDGRAINKC